MQVEIPDSFTRRDTGFMCSNCCAFYFVKITECDCRVGVKPKWLKVLLFSETPKKKRFTNNFLKETEMSKSKRIDVPVLGLGVKDKFKTMQDVVVSYSSSAGSKRFCLPKGTKCRVVRHNKKSVGVELIELPQSGNDFYVAPNGDTVRGCCIPITEVVSVKKKLAAKHDLTISSGD